MLVLGGTSVLSWARLLSFVFGHLGSVKSGMGSVGYMRKRVSCRPELGI